VEYRLEFVLQCPLLPRRILNTAVPLSQTVTVLSLCVALVQIQLPFGNFTVRRRLNVCDNVF
jgi:hypothetical protein